MRENRTIGFLSDFGVSSPFQGVVKGVILGINPGATVVDITHAVPPFDIGGGAFLLLTAMKYFPPGTVFLSVVDPGVGGERRALIAKSARYLFVGPDNGILIPASSRDGEVTPSSKSLRIVV